MTKLAGVASIHVIERGQLAKLRLGISDLFDASKAAKVGRLAGAQVVVIGGYVVFGKELMFNLRSVDTETRHRSAHRTDPGKRRDWEGPFRRPQPPGGRGRRVARKEGRHPGG